MWSGHAPGHGGGLCSSQNSPNYILKAQLLIRRRCTVPSVIAKQRSSLQTGLSAKRVGATGESSIAPCFLRGRLAAVWIVCLKPESNRNKAASRRDGPCEVRRVLCAGC